MGILAYENVMGYCYKLFFLQNCDALRTVIECTKLNTVTKRKGKEELREEKKRRKKKKRKERTWDKEGQQSKEISKEEHNGDNGMQIYIALTVAWILRACCGKCTVQYLQITVFLGLFSPEDGGSMSF
jgi:hypothetical protein